MPRWERHNLRSVLEYVQSIPFQGPIALMQEVRDTLLAVDQPEAMLRGLLGVVSETTSALESAVGMRLPEAAKRIRSGDRQAARQAAKSFVSHGLCKIVLGEQVGLVHPVYCRFCDLRADATLLK